MFEVSLIWTHLVSSKENVSAIGILNESSAFLKPLVVEIEIEFKLKNKFKSTL